MRQQYPPGVSVVRNSRGWTVLTLESRADPERTPAWLAEKERAMPSAVHFRREYQLDWSSAAGKPYFPEFVQHRKRFIRKAPYLLDGPVYRGWDFGRRHPACVWMQRSRTRRRAWILYEILGWEEEGGYGGTVETVGTHAFRDLVLYLSGQRTFEYLERRPRALQFLQALQLDPDLPEPPWFPPNVNFIDFAGHEALMAQANVEKEHEDRTAAAILASEGIDLSCHWTSVKAKEDVWRSLLQLQPPEMTEPGIYIQPCCRILIEGLNGGLAYKKPTPEMPDPADYQKNGHHDHVFEAASYPLTNIMGAVEDYRIQHPLVAGGATGRELVPAEPDDGGLDHSFPSW